MICEDFVWGACLVGGLFIFLNLFLKSYRLIINSFFLIDKLEKENISQND